MEQFNNIEPSDDRADFNSRHTQDEIGGLDLEQELSLKAISTDLRRMLLETVLAAESGHLGASSSSCELLTALYFTDILNYDGENPDHPDRDRVMLRGHLGPIRYGIFSKLGWIEESELVDYRKLGSRLQGHESMFEVPGVDITPSGSLGMVLSYGVGASIAASQQGKEFRSFVFLGDGEEQEGNVSEAARHAATLKLDNLICVLDKNGAQLGRRTEEVDGGASVTDIWKGYGWRVIEIADGHNLNEIYQAYSEALSPDEAQRPTLIVASTVKGYALNGAEDHLCGYHTISTCSKDIVNEAIADQKLELERLGVDEAEIRRLVAEQKKQHSLGEIGEERVAESSGNAEIVIGSEFDNLTDAQIAYFSSLRTTLLGNESQFNRVYALCADLIRVDQLDDFGFTPPVIYEDVGLREQHMFSLAHGLAVTDPNSLVVINGSDAFAYRSADQLHALTQGGSKVIYLADDAGISGAKNGESHQSTGQPGMIMAMPDIDFLEPADVNDFRAVMNEAVENNIEPTYIRLHQGNTPSLGHQHDSAQFQSSYIVHEPSKDTVDLVLVASGMPVFGAVDAAKELENSYGLHVRVINVVGPKRLDSEFCSFIEEDTPVLCIYNGNEQVLRTAVAGTILEHSGPRPSSIQGHGLSKGTSGALPDLVEHFKFDGSGIASVVKEKFPDIFS